ncbi:MAG: hypothetical protein GY866_32680, partial [Proteobacteria bacterium]|nr:hypothetical protein [Pseudomonadota bacterium]
DRLALSSKRGPNSLDSKSSFQVTATNITDGTEYETTTNDSGEYTLAALTEGQYQIVAENKTYAKSGSRTVSLARSTKTTIDIVLQAAGSIVGKAYGAYSVSIPGTSHIGMVAYDGSFQLTGVPVGTVWLRFDSESSLADDSYVDSDSLSELMQFEVWRPFSVAAGQNTFNQEIDFDKNMLQGVVSPMAGALGWSEVHGEGGTLYFTKGVTQQELETNISVVRIDGTTEIPVENLKIKLPKDITIDLSSIGLGDVPLESYCMAVGMAQCAIRSWRLVMDDVPEPGIYTVSVFGDSKSVFEVEDKTLTFLWREDGVNIIAYFFPEELGDATAVLGSITVADDSGTINVVTQAVDFGHGFFIHGDFRLGEEYTVTLPPAVLALTGDSFVRGVFGELVTIEAAQANIFRFPNPEIAQILPFNGSQGIGLNDQISVEFDGGMFIDPASIVISLSENGGDPMSYNASQLDFQSAGDPSGDSWLKSVTLPNASLKYGKNYELTATAKNMEGGPIASQNSLFSTIVPAIVRVQPDEAYENLGDVKNHYEADFNVPMDPVSGTLTVNGADLTANCQWDSSYTAFSCEPDGLLPDTEYTVEFAGFVAADGTPTAADVAFTHRTPPPYLHWTSIGNGDVNVDPSQHQTDDGSSNRIVYDIFGKLDDDQTADVAANLKVTTFGMEISGVEYSFVDNEDFYPESCSWGTILILVFDMSEGTFYKVGFDTVPDNLQGIMPAASLNFRTTGKGQVVIPPDAPTMADVTDIQTNGSFRIEMEDDHETTQMVFRVDEGKWAVPAVTRAFYRFDRGTNAFEATTDSYIDYIWDGTDWVADTLSGGSFNESTFTWTYTQPYDVTLALTGVADIGGQNEIFERGGQEIYVPLSSDAKRYHFSASVSYSNDTYMVYRIMDDNMGKTYTNLTNLIDDFGNNSVCIDHSDNDDDRCVRFQDFTGGDTSGNLEEWDWKSQTATPGSAGTWWVETVMNKQMLLTDMSSDAYDKNRVFTDKGGLIWKGAFHDASETESFQFWEHNSVVMADLEDFLADASDDVFICSYCGGGDDGAPHLAVPSSMQNVPINPLQGVTDFGNTFFSATLPSSGSIRIDVTDASTDDIAVYICAPSDCSSQVASANVSGGIGTLTYNGSSEENIVFYVWGPLVSGSPAPTFDISVSDGSSGSSSSIVDFFAGDPNLYFFSEDNGSMYLKRESVTNSSTVMARYEGLVTAITGDIDLPLTNDPSKDKNYDISGDTLVFTGAVNLPGLNTLDLAGQTQPLSALTDGLWEVTATGNDTPVNFGTGDQRYDIGFLFYPTDLSTVSLPTDTESNGNSAYCMSKPCTDLAVYINGTYADKVWMTDSPNTDGTYYGLLLKPDNAGDPLAGGDVVGILLDSDRTTFLNTIEVDLGIRYTSQIVQSETVLLVPDPAGRNFRDTLVRLDSTDNMIYFMDMNLVEKVETFMFYNKSAAEKIATGLSGILP